MKPNSLTTQPRGTIPSGQKLSLNPRDAKPHPPKEPKKPETKTNRKSLPKRQWRKSIYEHTPEYRAKRARRNADTHTAMSVLGTASTATFLVCGGLAAYYGVQYGKHEATNAVLGQAAAGANELFDTSGNLNRDAMDAVSHVPGGTKILKDIEKRSNAENQSIQETIGEMQGEERAGSKKSFKNLKGTAIGAGVGLLGMLIFLTGAGIAKHRGKMLWADRSSKSQASFSPEVGPHEAGGSLKISF